MIDETKKIELRGQVRVALMQIKDAEEKIWEAWLRLNEATDHPEYVPETPKMYDLAFKLPGMCSTLRAIKLDITAMMTPTTPTVLNSVVAATSPATQDAVENVMKCAS